MAGATWHHGAGAPEGGRRGGSQSRASGSVPALTPSVPSRADAQVRRPQCMLASRETAADPHTASLGSVSSLNTFHVSTCDNVPRPGGEDPEWPNELKTNTRPAGAVASVLGRVHWGGCEHRPCPSGSQDAWFLPPRRTSGKLGLAPSALCELVSVSRLQRPPRAVHPHP